MCRSQSLYLETFAFADLMLIQRVRVVKNTGSIKHVVIPSNIVLTPRVLLAAMCKLPLEEIEIVIEGLIMEADLRCDDPDLEPEPIEADHAA